MSDIRAVPWFVLPPAMETYYRLQHADYRPLPPLRPDCRARGGTRGRGGPGLRLPEGGRDPLRPGRDGRLARAAWCSRPRTATPRTAVFWHLDGEYQGETRDIHQMALAPAPGPHVLTLVDENGKSVSRSFRALRRERPIS